ncbi:MAG: universal stress protein [Bacillota bacterium]
MFKRIMLAFDNSLNAQKAVQMGYELAKTHNCEMHVVAVIHLPDYAGTIDEVDDVVKEGKKFYTEAINAVVAEGVKQGIEMHSKILYGHIGNTLIKYAKENGVDLIITGAHGRSPIGKLLLGSVSDYVVKHSGCPVLIVKG